MTAQLDQKDLLDRAARLVEAAKRAGADAADAVCVRGMSMSIEVRLGKVEETRRADPDELAARAVAMAKVAPEDRYAGLAAPERLARTFPDLDLLDQHIPSADELTERALAVEDAARAVPGVSNSGGGSAGWRLSGIVLATSGGFAGATLSSRFSTSVSAIAGTGTGMERDYDFDMRIHHGDLAAPEVIGRKAGERAVARLNPRKMATGNGAVVYDPRLANGLVSSLAGAVNGASIARKTSFLRQKLGQ